MLHMTTYRTVLFSTFYNLSHVPNSTLLAPLLVEYTYLSILFIHQMISWKINVSIKTHFSTNSVQRDRIQAVRWQMGWWTQALVLWRELPHLWRVCVIYLCLKWRHLSLIFIHNLSRETAPGVASMFPDCCLDFHSNKSANASNWCWSKEFTI